MLSFQWKNSTYDKIWSIFQKSAEATYDFHCILWENLPRSTTDCFNTIGYIPTRHQMDLSKPCKLTCASLIMSKKAMPLLYPPKKGMRKFERYLWETSLLFNTKKRAPSDCASRGNLLMRMCFCLIHFASNNSTLQLLGKIEVTNSIGTESDFSKCLQRG